MVYLYLFFILPILTATVHSIFSERPQPKGYCLELWISHILFWAVGICGVVAFVANSFGEAANWVAGEWLGWAKGSPFQETLGWAYLAVGVAALAAPWIKGGFRVATILIAVILAVGESITLWWYDAPTRLKIYSIIYDWGGSVLLILLMWAYHARVGTKVFWDYRGVSSVARKGKK